MENLGIRSLQDLRRLKDIEPNYMQREHLSPTYMVTTCTPAIRIWFCCSIYYNTQSSMLKEIVSVKHNGAASEIISQKVVMAINDTQLL